MMRRYVTKWFFGGKKRVERKCIRKLSRRKKKRKKEADWEKRERRERLEAGTFPIEFDSIKLLTLSGLASDMLVNTNIFYLIVKH